ncbi:hypothetical protein GH722_01075 [Alphaproteobacteria bacterium HT1-32]|nr:hypothetical protein [Alphaproteobacteria bacterium HT1-32]
MNNQIDYARAALMLRTAGQQGDVILAHLTPGEVVVPVTVLDTTPQLAPFLKEAFGRANLNIGRYTVGGADDSRNPVTGLPEYFDVGHDHDARDMIDDSGFGGFGDEEDSSKTGGYGGENQSNDGDHGHETDGGTFYYAASDATQSQDLSEAISVTEPESEPRRRRTVLTALNIRRPKLSIGDELLGPSPKGKVKLGQ